MTIGKFLVERNVINDSPPYQRESGIWSLEKQQLFLDSLFNDFDVPKIYLHDISGEKGRFTYTVIDGKQRLTTIWDFLDDKITLASDFELYDAVKAKAHPIKPGVAYSKLSDWWKETFKNTSLAVTLVAHADEEDIEELFSRLNNGEPLSASEKRNAKAGAMVSLIRDVAGLKFFRDRVSFSNKRLQHHEVAAKFLLIEHSERTKGEPFCDLKKRFLDQLVDQHKTMSSAEAQKMKAAVESSLKKLVRLFSKKDPLLGKQAYPPLYYLFVKVIEKEYADKELYSRMKKFLSDFQLLRLQNLQKKEDDREQVLTEFSAHMQQGTNDLNSLRQRVATMRRFFLLKNNDVSLRDKKRTFSPEERVVIYLLADKVCAKCKKQIPTLDEMEADHQRQWAHGGETTLINARCLCESCNQEEKAA